MSNLGLTTGNTDIEVFDANGNLLRLGLDPANNLVVQITDPNGVVLFDAFQEATAIVSNTNVSGDFTDIQKAIDAVEAIGGGTVTIRNGTYPVNSDIVLPSNVTLQGETGGGVIIDFQNQSHQIRASGVAIDSGGTVSVNNNSTTVTGVLTDFDPSMTGTSILLRGRWFTIESVTDNYHLVISQPFDADSITNQNNIIANPVFSVTLINFTVQNSTHPDGAVYLAYIESSTLNNVTVLTSTIGINSFAATTMNMLNFFVSGCGTGVLIINCAVATVYNFEIYGSTGDNLVCSNYYNTSVSNSTISSAGGNNITLTGCEAWGLYDFENTTAGRHGIEIIGGIDIEVFAMSIRDAGLDGIKLTSDCQRVSIHNVTLRNSGGYGLNINNGTSSKNTITSSFYVNNAFGTIRDNGVSTINANNQT